jgi:hypothetical protein
LEHAFSQTLNELETALKDQGQSQKADN